MAWQNRGMTLKIFHVTTSIKLNGGKKKLFSIRLKKISIKLNLGSN